MNASIVPLEVASKQSNAFMICPLGKTSIFKRPPLISSTTCASRTAEPCMTSSCGGQAVDMRHWNFGWAITFGASAMTAAPAAAAPAGRR